jgi:hypothetical protein
MRTLQREDLKANISQLDVSYMSGLPKDTLLYWCSRIDLKVKKSSTKHVIAKALFNFCK